MRITYADQEDDPEARRRREEEDGISTKPPGEGGADVQLQAGGDLSNDQRGIPISGPSRQYTAEEQDFLRRNPGDEARMAQALGNQTGHRPFDSQTTDPQQQAANQRADQTLQPQNAPPPLGNVYGNYLGQPTQAPQVDLSPLTQQIQQMQQQQQEERQRQQMERAALRELISGRMAEAAKPVDVNAPGIKEQLASQRLARQRSAERQRSQTATKMASEGLGDSGAMDTALSGIEQQRGEGESADIAQVMGGELQAKRSELMQLLQMATSSGDAEMARNVQMQLAGIDAEMQKQQMADVNSRFGQDLGFRKSSFVDNLGLQIMLAQLGANQNAAGAFL